MRLWILEAATATAVWMAPVYAHHSLSGVYDTAREVRVEGVVIRFQFINPHPFVLVSVETPGEAPQEWRMEMDNRFELTQIGMNGETLKPGDHVVAVGSPGRSQSQILYIRRLDRPADGLRYEQVGSSPRIRFPANR